MYFDWPRGNEQHQVHLCTEGGHRGKSFFASEKTLKHVQWASLGWPLGNCELRLCRCTNFVLNKSLYFYLQDCLILQQAFFCRQQQNCMYSTKIGIICFPRIGTGAKYGASVSQRRRWFGIDWIIFSISSICFFLCVYIEP